MATTNLNRVSNHFQRSPQDMTGINPEYFAVATSKIFIIGEQDPAMTSLANMLQSDYAYRSVGCIEPDDECLEKIAAARPDALLIQNEVLPQPIDKFVRKVRQQVPEARILLFGAAMNDDCLYDLVRAGAHGYVSERADPEHIQHALGQVLQGNSWFERHILERFVTNQQRSDQRLEAEFNARIEQLSEQLTRRELEILGEVVKGLAIKQIAEHVHLSHQGVKMHLAKLFKKFNVSNRNQLILAVFDEISPLEDLSVMLQNGLNTQLFKKYRRNGHQAAE